MAMTLTQYLDSLKWVMYEKGLQVHWNTLKRITNSTMGSGVASTVLDALRITDNTSNIGIIATSGESNSGPIIPQPVDYGGNVGPTPLRQSNSKPPVGGFLPNAD